MRGRWIERLPAPANLLGVDLTVRMVRFEASRFAWSDYARLGIPLPPRSMHMRCGRAAEHLAGRHCARSALQALDPHAANPLAGYDGSAPRWPAGVVGSITHSRTLAAAAVCQTTTRRAVGIDVEPLMDAFVAGEVAPLIACRREVAIAHRALGDAATAVTAAFSVKEAAYKCLSPLDGGFDDPLLARLDAIDAQGNFSLSVERPALPRVDLTGRVAIAWNHVHALATAAT